MGSIASGALDAAKAGSPQCTIEQIATSKSDRFEIKPRSDMGDITRS
jgi:hypothetical protein